MLKAVAYRRVSTVSQSEFGVSLDAQKEKLMQYAKLYDYEIIDDICDAGRSAKDLNRDGIKNILYLMRTKQIDAVLITKLDRLTRSLRDLSDIVDLANKNNVAIVSVAEHIDSSSAAGRMMVNLLMTVSQWERETLSERTKASLQYKKNNGKVYNGVPLYGFSNNDGLLVPNEDEQVVTQYIMELYNNGMRVASICRKLRGRGLKTRKGSYVWHSQVVSKIIKDHPVREQILSNAA